MANEEANLSLDLTSWQESYSIMVEGLDKYKESLSKLGSTIGVNLKIPEVTQKSIAAVRDKFAEIRDGEGWAGVKESLGTLTTEFAALESAILPAGTTFAGLANEYFPGVTSAAAQVVGTVNQMGAAVNTAAATFSAATGIVDSVMTGYEQMSAVVDQLKTVGSALIPVLSGINLPMIAIGLGIAALIAAGILLYQNWDTVKVKALEIWGAIKDYLIGAWEGIKETAMTVWNSITAFFAEWGQILLTVILGPLGLLISLIIEHWDTIKTATVETWNSISEFFSTLWAGITELFNNVLTRIVIFISEKWNELKTTTMDLFNAIYSFLTGLWNTIKGFFTTLLTDIVTFFREKWDELKRSTTKLFDEVKSYLLGLWREIKDKVVGVVQDLLTKLREKFNELKTAVMEKMGEVKSTLFSIWDEVMAFFQGINLYEMGKNILQGLLDGIVSMADRVWDKVKEIADGVKDKIADALDIFSPSRVMIGMGEHIGEGLAIGMGRTVRDIDAQSMRLAMAAAPGLTHDTTRMGEGVLGEGRSLVPAQITQHIAIHSPKTLSPSEIKRKHLQASRRLAQEWVMKL